MTAFLLTRDKLLLDSSSRARTSGDEARNANYTLLNLQVAGNRPRVKIARRLRRTKDFVATRSSRSSTRITEASLRSG